MIILSLKTESRMYNHLRRDISLGSRSNVPKEIEITSMFSSSPQRNSFIPVKANNRHCQDGSCTRNHISGAIELT